MPQQVVELECPGCAAAISTATKTCPHCFRPIVVSTLNTISGLSPLDLNKQANAYKKAMARNPDNKDLNMSIAFCYLKLKLYDKAIESFKKALDGNFEDSEAYFYAAIALLKGKKAFLASRDVINKIIEYIDAANMIEPKGIYYYFLGYVKLDYFERKYLKNSPSSRECKAQAVNLGLSDYDVSELYNLLGVARPAGF